MLKRDPRKSYHHGDLEEAMVREGMAEVEREGIRGLSMRRVADQLDVSSAAPWHHFKKGRASFSAAIAEAAFRQMRSSLERRIGRDKSPIENLAAVFQGYTRFAIDNPGLYRAMFSPEVSEGLEHVDMSDPKADRHYAALLAEKGLTYNMFVDLVREGQRAGQLREGDAAQLARLVTSLAHGLSLEFIDEQLGRRISRRKQAAMLFELLLDGIGSSRRNVRVVKMKDEDELEDYRGLTPSERLGMMQTLALNAWAMTGETDVDRKLSRSHIRIQRRER